MKVSHNTSRLTIPAPTLLEVHEQEVLSLCRRLKLQAQKACARNYSMKFRELISDIANLATVAKDISDPTAQDGRIDSL